MHLSMTLFGHSHDLHDHTTPAPTAPTINRVQPLSEEVKELIIQLYSKLYESKNNL